jgi:predicted HNH restriction endonuclease
MRATELNKKWKVGAKHALYIHDGHWYHCLTKFPGALFDKNGYILFATEAQYRASTYLKIYNETNQVWIKPPGISTIPGYVRVESATGSETGIYAEELSDEGARRLRMHFESERKPQNARAKKQSALSLACEICGFSFLTFYGPAAAQYCEVHHRVPLKSLRRAARVKLNDLAILCSNCHRVVHLRYPPYQLKEVRNMIGQASRKGN